MSIRLESHIPTDQRSEESHRRSAWRQRLVDAERGVTHGVRRDSTFFVHFFVGSIILVAAVVLGIGSIEWTFLVLAFTMVLSAEMFNQVLKSILQSVGHHFQEPAERALRIGTAAVFVTMTGSLIVTGLVFGRHLMTLLG